MWLIIDTCMHVLVHTDFLAHKSMLNHLYILTQMFPVSFIRHAYCMILVGIDGNMGMQLRGIYFQVHEWRCLIM